MPSIDLIIPTYTITPQLLETALACVESYRDQANVIVVEDGGDYSSILFKRAHTYIHCKDNVGFTKNVNRGLRFSDADYTMVAGSDTYLREGKLRDLCIPGKVTSPHIVNQSQETMHGSFFVIPREIKAKYGILNETMRTYYSDQDYSERIKDIFQKVDDVEIYHHIAQTVKAAGVEGGEEVRTDEAAYNNLKK